MISAFFIQNDKFKDIYELLCYNNFGDYIVKQPKKWRDCIDPFTIKFDNFNLLKILGYSHARNDVFYCKGIIYQKPLFCYLKVARENNDIKNETEKLLDIEFKHIPKIIEFDKKDFSYIITKKIQGKRLSEIVGDNRDNKSLNYMFEFGKTLAQIHELNNKTNLVKSRKFFEIPNQEYCEKNNISYVRDWLIKNKPKSVDYCFCHGDLHYANLLWNKGHISGILDWELAGKNIREYDVAWSLILRPNQKFMNTKKELDLFLEGYKSIHNLNVNYVKYYMVQIYTYFYTFKNNSETYNNYILDFFQNNCI